VCVIEFPSFLVLSGKRKTTACYPPRQLAYYLGYYNSYNQWIATGHKTIHGDVGTNGSPSSADY